MVFKNNKDHLQDGRITQENDAINLKVMVQALAFLYLKHLIWPISIHLFFNVKTELLSLILCIKLA